MPLDRVAVLRNAEKLLRQGKLEPAIAEYLRIVEDQPRDLNSTNTLGDLYQRAGQVDKAIEQYVRIATILHDDGFLQKAAALYKKILKLKPDDEHVLLQAAEVAATQGLLVDARRYFKTVADRRRARGDARGVTRIMIRLGTLDPADFQARAAAAAARAEMGEVTEALAELKALAAELSELGRQPEAIETLRQASLIDPSDTALREHLARTFVASGDLDAASEYLTADSVGVDPQLQLMAAELQLRGGNADAGMALIRRVLEQDPARREDVAGVGWKLAAELPEPAFRVVELAAETALVQTDWALAAAVLQEYVTLVPNHIPALMRLVEISVDGGLEATMYAAQAQLADAYIAAGMGPEARFIAEDLVAREPWERANIERFRRSLVLLGETDPDGVIAERLGGQTPFMSTDVITRVKFPSIEENAVRIEAPPDEVPGEADIADDDPLDLACLAGLEPPVVRAAAPGAADIPQAHAAQESVEVDLSIVLGDIGGADADGEAHVAGQAGGPLGGADLESVFAQLRGEASRLGGGDAGEENLRRGMSLRQAGKIDESLEAFEIAARSPRLRFQAATLIGRTHRERGCIRQAIEWFDRATEAPAPTADEGHLLMYELADALESAGDVGRALAVCIALQANAPEFRDVAARIDRLSRAQTRG